MPSRPTFAFVLAVAACAGASGCGGSHRPAAATSSTTTTISAPAPTVGPRDRWGTSWLCRPGLAGNPCASNDAATVVDPGGKTRTEPAAPSGEPPVDCFYVYPTVSGAKTINAGLGVGFREREIAFAQASRFSSVCRVYAPVYRQITLSALDHPGKITLAAALIAYRSVVSAFHDYLAHYNHGRGIVFLGHSQGATILIRLLRQEVDGNPALRRRLVSALLLGGNVTVPRDATVGGDFAHLPECTSRSETGCVVAYSSFTSEPLPNSQFGRTSSDAGVGLLARPSLPPSMRIMCVNPAAPGGGAAPLDPYLPTLVVALTGSTVRLTTPWAAFPGDYTGRCESSGNATWLQVTPTGAGVRSREVLTRLTQPILGLHLLDVNIALGDLVRLVRVEAAHYRRG